MLVLPLWLLVFKYLGEGKSGFEEMMQTLQYALIIVEVVLALVIAWLLKYPAMTEVRVSKDEFSISTPWDEYYCFSIKPSDIIRISHSLDVQNKIPIIIMETADGQKRRLFQESFSLKKLYAALATANPAIELPENPNLFSVKN